MASISPEACARALLEACLEGKPWRERHLAPLLSGAHSHLLFRVVAEGLADRFEPALCDAYARLFSDVIARCIDGLHAPHLLDRYRRIRAPRIFEGDPAAIRRVFVLSRVTLGADIAVTSVLLDAARRKFPQASIALAGPRKSWELFAGSKISHIPVAYRRDGSLESRFAVFDDLRNALCCPASVVIDPDSRLTQLGLLPVCAEENYFFFESRALGGAGGDSIGALARRWACLTFGLEECGSFLNPHPPEISLAADITVSLGVGENPSKRIPGNFERDLLGYLAGKGTVLVDKGAGGEEAARVEYAIGDNAGRIQVWDGSFAGFASHIARSKFYAGYDSAGAHAAASAGVPLVSVFAGFASERMFQRWRPTGRAASTVIRADDPVDPGEVWQRTRAALDNFFATAG